MSVSSVGSTNPLSYLQSLLTQGSSSSPAAAAVSDPLLALFNDFSGGSPPGNAGSSGPPLLGPNTPQLSASTLATLFSVQGQQPGGSSSASQSVFAKFDANGDGQVSQTEFENAIGPNADKAKVDALFKKIDSNGDGQISQDELSSAAQKAQGHHHHHHAHGGGEAKSGGSGQSGGLKNLLSSTDATGATSQTEAGADGSTTTTVTYADGSKVTMTMPAAGSVDSQQLGNKNLIEQLIKLQSQLLTPSVGGTLATA